MHSTGSQSSALVLKACLCALLVEWRGELRDGSAMALPLHAFCWPTPMRIAAKTSFEQPQRCVVSNAPQRRQWLVSKPCFLMIALVAGRRMTIGQSRHASVGAITKFKCLFLVVCYCTIPTCCIPVFILTRLH